MITLFPDQQRSIDLLRASMKKHRSILLQGETGSGKSIMASYMIKSAQEKGHSCAFVVPRKDLLFQMHKTFQKFSLPHGYVASGHIFDPFSKNHICMTGTLVNRVSHIKPKVVFLDECHYSGKQLDTIINYYKAQGAWVVGMSASPEKHDGTGLDAYYDDMVCGPTVSQLIALKRLSEYRLFAPSQPDFSKIKVVNGDYSKSQIEDFMEKDNLLIGDAVRNYKQHAMGKLNITFCTSIEHSKKSAERFNADGIPTVHMDGETPEDERRKIAKAFAKRELLNICSVNLMTFGYDLSAASGIDNVTIESMSDLRPTKSLTLQRQKNGRVLRYKDFPAMIFDHSGNNKVHGMPCDDIFWTLKGRDKKTRDMAEKMVEVRQCPSCYRCFKPAPVCPACNYEFPVKYRTIAEIEGELEEVKAADAVNAKKRRMEIGMAKTKEEIEAIAKERGYRAGWIRKQCKIKKIKF